MEESSGGEKKAMDFNVSLKEVRRLAASIVGRPFGEPGSSSGAKLPESLSAEKVVKMEDKADDEIKIESQQGEPMDEDGSSSDDGDDSEEGGEEEEEEEESEDDEHDNEDPNSDEVVAERLDWLLDVESEAATAQEALEDESINRVREEVRAELAEKLSEAELEAAVEHEMKLYIENWETELQELQTESATLQEQLENAGVSLPDVYKLIDKHAAEACQTEAWKKRAHWSGTQASEDFNEVLKSAEEELETHRPVMRRRGKLVEAGASGFLEKKVIAVGSSQGSADWSLIDGLSEPRQSSETRGFGSKEWFSVYSASTPEQAVRLGLRFRGAAKVEELVETDKPTGVEAAALAEEGQHGLTELQKKNMKRVLEKDDVEMQKRSKRKQGKANDEQSAHLTKDENAKDKVDENVVSKPMQSTQCEPHEQSPTIQNTSAPQPQDDDQPEDSDDDVMVISPSRVAATPSETRKRARSWPEVIVVEDDAEAPSLQSAKANGNDKDALDETTSPLKGGEQRVNVKKPRVGIDDDDSDQDKSDKSSYGAPVEKQQKKKYLCTVCGEAVVCGNVLPHPVLEVVTCKLCCDSYQNTKFSKDGDTDAECTWCGECGDVICCDFCPKVFCIPCICRNLGGDTLKAIENLPTAWKCFCCDPSQLEKLRKHLRDAQAASKSTKGAYNILQSRAKRRKNIRKERVEDDEKTKMLVEREKERREKLKKWYENQNKDKAFYGVSRTATKETKEGRHLCDGDCKVLGCVINIANRENDEPLIRIPASLSNLLKAHQLLGVRFMWENCIESVKKVKSGEDGLGCILAHSMGLGKTLQVITFLYTVMKSADLGFKTALIIVPVNVLHNWRAEFEKWKPQEVEPFPIYMLEDVQRDSRPNYLRKWSVLGGVMLLGYAAFRLLSLGKRVKDQETKDLLRECLHDPGPDLLICDEAHTIKNKKADITQELQHIKCKRRIALTGSPLQNNLMEYFCMVNFVRAGFLGPEHQFRNRFQNPIAFGQHADSTASDVKRMKQKAHVLHSLLAGFVQRMTTSVLKSELPPKSVWVISVRLSPLQKELYKKYLCTDRKSLLDDFHVFSKIWNHPDLLWLASEEQLQGGFIVDSDKEDEEAERNGNKPESEGINYEWCQDILKNSERHVLENSGKMALIFSLLEMSEAQSEKVLIFSQSLLTLDLIEDFLVEQKSWTSGRDWYRMDGAIAASKRQQIADNFNDPNNTAVKCVLVSTKAGSLGINLIGASRVIIVDSAWNPTHDLQALFRAWRMGQTKPVYVYRLLAHGTMEHKIYNRQLTKEGLAARVLDEHQVGRHLTADDLQIDLTFNDDDEDEDPDYVPPDKQTDEVETSSSKMVRKAKHKSFNVLPPDAPPRDEMMAMLLIEHRPRWIKDYHEHEPLLEDLEDEKLTMEEKVQALAQAMEEYKNKPESESVDPAHALQSAASGVQVQSQATSIRMQTPGQTSWRPVGRPPTRPNVVPTTLQPQAQNPVGTTAPPVPIRPTGVAPYPTFVPARPQTTNPLAPTSYAATATAPFRTPFPRPTTTAARPSTPIQATYPSATPVTPVSTTVPQQTSTTTARPPPPFRATYASATPITIPPPFRATYATATPVTTVPPQTTSAPAPIPTRATYASATATSVPAATRTNIPPPTTNTARAPTPPQTPSASTTSTSVPVRPYVRPQAAAPAPIRTGIPQPTNQAKVTTAESSRGHCTSGYHASLLSSHGVGLGSTVVCPKCAERVGWESLKKN